MIIERPCTTCGYSLEKGVKIVGFADFLLGCMTITFCATILANFDALTINIETNLTDSQTNLTANYSSILFECVEESLNVTETPELLDTSAELNSTGVDNATALSVIDYETGTPEIPCYWNLANLTTNSTEAKRKHLPEDWSFERTLLIIVLVFAVIQVCIVQFLVIGMKKKSTPFLYAWLIISGFSTPATGFLIKMYMMIVVFAYSEELKVEQHGQALEEFRKLPYSCNIKTQLYPRPRCGQSQVQEEALEEEGDKEELKIPKVVKIAKRRSQRKVSECKNGKVEDENGSRGRTAYFQDKSFVMNVPGAMFAAVQHKRDNDDS